MTPSARPRLSMPVAVDGQNPWPGLAAFTEQDRAFFHGRETETDALRRLIMRGRLTVLLGKSGRGKTSLLRAGLFPRVRGEGLLPVYTRLDYAAGAPPLAEQVQQALAAAAADAEVEAPEWRQSDTLWEGLHRKGADFWDQRNRPVQLMLVFDQFEEFFTLGKESRPEDYEAFLDELGDLIEGRTPAALKARLNQTPAETEGFSLTHHFYKVVLSLREDFVADLEGLRDRVPSVVHNRLRLRAMTGQQALAALTGAGGSLFAPGIADVVVRFVADAEPEAPLAELQVEPALLSLICRELNAERVRRRQPQITGDLVEGRGAEILADFYARSLKDLRGTGKGWPTERAMRALIEEQLLTDSGHRDSVALERAIGMRGVSEAAVQRLIDRRLLHVEEHAGVKRLELTHDVLTDVVRSSRDVRLGRQRLWRRSALVVAFLGVALAISSFIGARKTRQVAAARVEAESTLALLTSLDAALARGDRDSALEAVDGLRGALQQVGATLGTEYERPRVIQDTGPAPAYPERASGVGEVVVRAVVDSTGRVEQGTATVVRSTDAAFDSAALWFVQRSRFEPSRVDGRPVRGLTEVAVTLTPPEQGAPAVVATVELPTPGDTVGPEAVAVVPPSPRIRSDDGVPGRRPLRGDTITRVGGDVDEAALPAATAQETVRTRDDLPAAGRARDELVYTEAVVDELPVLVRAGPTEYPRGAQGVGAVVLQAIVDTTGRVEQGSIQVAESTAEIFEAAARRFLEGSEFTPGRVGGRPARVLIRIPVNFRPGGR